LLFKTNVTSADPQKLTDFEVKFMKDLVIREAIDKDVNGIIEVLKSIYLKDEEWARRALRKLLATENYIILVAELNGAVIGFIDYYVLPSVWEK